MSDLYLISIVFMAVLTGWILSMIIDHIELLKKLDKKPGLLLAEGLVLFAAGILTLILVHAAWGPRTQISTESYPPGTATPASISIAK